MGILEDALRETFAAQVKSPPAVEDAADRAIGASGRVRRRRRAIGATAVAVTIAAAGLGWALGTSPGSGGNTYYGFEVPSNPPPSPRPLVDVLVQNRIIRADGPPIDLTQIPAPDFAWRTDDGWLIRAGDAPSVELWHVGLLGVQTLVKRGTFVAVSADGLRVAWSSNGRVHIGRRLGATVTPTDQTGNTGDLVPLAFVDGGVLLGSPTEDGGIASYDMWFPDRGAFRPGPEWSSKILGASADGTRLYGMTGGKEQCLVEIDPDGMTKLRSACGPAIAPADRAWPSPDRRWLVTTGPTFVLLYDLTTVWSHPGPITGPTLENATGVVWYDDESLVVSATGWLLRMYFHQGARSEELPAVAPPGATQQAIPRLGAS